MSYQVILVMYLNKCDLIQLITQIFPFSIVYNINFIFPQKIESIENLYLEIINGSRQLQLFFPYYKASDQG